MRNWKTSVCGAIVAAGLWAHQADLFDDPKFRNGAGLITVIAMILLGICAQDAPPKRTSSSEED